MKRVLFLLFIAFLTLGFLSPAQAATITFGWEDDETILGNNYDITATIDNTIAYSGLSSLKLVDGGESTPQAYVGWVEGLNAGDVVTASLWIYDTTPAASPSGRIWGHYNEFNDINDYAGSASGNYTYSDGTGWSFLEYSWTYSPTDLDATGLVIEVRTYSDAGDTIWVDDMTITAPDYATIYTPGETLSPVPIPGAIWLLGTGLISLLGIRRKKA